MKRITYLLIFIVIITLASCRNSIYDDNNYQPICPCKVISIVHYNFNSNEFYIITYEGETIIDNILPRSFRTKNSKHYIGEIIE